MIDVTPTELQAAIDLIRAGKAPIQLTASDILSACKLGIVGPSEAHQLLGLPDPVPVTRLEPVRSSSWLAKLLR